ncbi:MAG: hypothetical protein AABZ47_04140, partial [Planctomycetota bacterium]
YRQEFLCEFIDESTAFLTHDQIVACVDPLLCAHASSAPLIDDPRDLFVGVDIGRHHDLTVLWVLARTNPSRDCEGAVENSTLNAFALKKCHDMAPEFTTVAIIELAAAPFTEQSAVLDELLRIPNVRRCCIDAGGIGMQLAEQTVEKFGPHRVEPITFTLATKSQLATALRIAVETRKIRIPNDDRVRNDWHSLERTITGAGQFRLNAARRDGSHADRFWAAALALRAAGTCGAGGFAFGPIDWMPGSRLAYARGGTW